MNSEIDKLKIEHDQRIHAEYISKKLNLELKKKRKLVAD